RQSGRRASREPLWPARKFSGDSARRAARAGALVQEACYAADRCRPVRRRRRAALARPARHFRGDERAPRRRSRAYAKSESSCSGRLSLSTAPRNSLAKIAKAAKKNQRFEFKDLQINKSEFRPLAILASLRESIRFPGLRRTDCDRRTATRVDVLDAGVRADRRRTRADRGEPAREMRKRREVLAVPGM